MVTSERRGRFRLGAGAGEVAYYCDPEVDGSREDEEGIDCGFGVGEGMVEGVEEGYSRGGEVWVAVVLDDLVELVELMCEVCR
jgi:hypothetical protein